MQVKEYNKNDVSNGGHIVKQIISRNEKCIVFLDENDLTCFEYAVGNKSSAAKVINKYHEISHIIPYDLPEKTLSAIKISLGTALFNALTNCDQDLEDALKYFESIELRLKNTISLNVGKSILIIINLILVLIVVSICTLIYSAEISPYFNAILCVGMGTFGALFSLLQRNSKIEIHLTSGYFYIVLQAIFIVVLGGMSGLVMYILIKSGIAFSAFQNNIYSTSILCIIGGFSERFVPDLFSSIENKDTKI